MRVGDEHDQIGWKRIGGGPLLQRLIPPAARKASEGNQSDQEDDQPDPEAPEDHEDDADDDEDPAKRDPAGGSVATLWLSHCHSFG